MKTYDLYGAPCESLEAAKRAVEKALDVQLAAHESGYHAGLYYRLGDVGAEHIILQRNFDAAEGEWCEPERSDQPFLLFVNETCRPDALRARLEGEGLVLLKRDELE